MSRPVVRWCAPSRMTFGSSQTRAPSKPAARSTRRRLWTVCSLTWKRSASASQKSSASALARKPVSRSSGRATGQVNLRKSRFGLVCTSSSPPGASTRRNSLQCDQRLIGIEVLDHVAAEDAVEARVRPRQRVDRALPDVGAVDRRQRFAADLDRRLRSSRSRPRRRPGARKRAAPRRGHSLRRAPTCRARMASRSIWSALSADTPRSVRNSLAPSQ